MTLTDRDRYLLNRVEDFHYHPGPDQYVRAGGGLVPGDDQERLDELIYQGFVEDPDLEIPAADLFRTEKGRKALEVPA